MILHQSRILIASILLLSCVCAATAQQKSGAVDDSQSADKAVREKAYALLASLVEQIPTLQSAENRARLGSNIAASIWDHDEKLARGLLNGVEEEIRSALQNLAQDEIAEIQTRMVFLHLRIDTVERIAKRDPDLALAFLKATEPSPDPTARYPMTDDERALEMRLAKSIAAENPEMALKLGRQSLAKGLSEDVFSLLRTLQRKHAEQGKTLYKEIVAKVRGLDLTHRSYEFYLATRLVHAFAPPAVEDSDYREFVGVFISAALASGCGNKMSDDDPRGGFCSQFGSLIKTMEKVDAVGAARLKQWQPEQEEYGWPGEAYYELNEVAENGSPDEILAVGRKYPQLEADVYWRAMMKAEQLGDLDQASKIANEFSGDPEQRTRMLAQLEQTQKWATLSDEKLAEIQKSLTEIKRPEERIGMLVMLAGRANVKDRKLVLKLLDQANTLIDTMKPGKEQTEYRLGIAMIYCSHGSDRGLAIIESMLPRLNELVDAAAKLDGYEHHYLREGEWNMSNEGTVGEILTVLAQNAGYFAWCDFDRAVSLTAQFTRPEMRMMAQLKLAQAILAGRPKAFPFRAPSLDY